MIGAILRFFAMLFGIEEPPRPPATPPPPNEARPRPERPPPAPPAGFSLSLLVARDPSPASDEDIEAFAQALSVPVWNFHAVLDVETGRFNGFDPKTRRPVILFEPHQFRRLTGAKYDLSNPRVSHRVTWENGKRIAPYPYPDSQEARWAQLAEAATLDMTAALSACSWGKPQIMGFNHRICGFLTVHEFAVQMARDEPSQLECVVRFINGRRLTAALREGRWGEFEIGYNGGGLNGVYAQRLLDRAEARRAYWGERGAV